MYYIFDVCDTLYYSNTTNDFISFVLKRNKPYQLKKNELINKKNIVFFYRYFIFKFFKIDLFKRCQVKLLKGYSKEFLKNEANRFLNDFLLTKEINDVQVHLSKIDKRYVVLLSAGLDVVINEISNHFGVNFHSSQLEYNKGICTGKLKYDMTGKKHLFIEQYLPFVVFTDNFSDKILVSKAKEKNIIVYKPSDKNRWKEGDVKYIKLYK